MNSIINFFKKHRQAKWFATTIFFIYLAAFLDSISASYSYVVASSLTAAMFFVIAVCVSGDPD